jgi:hypothetical protein
LPLLAFHQFQPGITASSNHPKENTANEYHQPTAPNQRVARITYCTADNDPNAIVVMK